MKHIYCSKPSSWAGELWREALPVGNGFTGALLSGGAGVEHIWLNHFDRWEGQREELPDVKEAFLEQRRLVLEGKYREAKTLLSDALKEKGYNAYRGVPSAPVTLRVDYNQKLPFRGYERGLEMDTGTAYTRFTTGGCRQERKAFVSDSDVFVYEFTSEAPVDLRVSRPSDELRIAINGSFANRVEYESFIDFTGVTSMRLCCAFGREPDIDAAPSRSRVSGASLSLGDGDHSNNELLDRAYADGADGELVAKLWEFGRYLFASGTREGGYPFPLYGLWHGTANPQWSQNVANENVEMIYWHACPGDMAELVRPLIHYYYNKIPDSRENAMKLFGCRGIAVSVYSTPVSGLIAPNVPVITNYTGCAGWLSRHFYEYWLYTRDSELLESEILPFMLESARFYEDYIVYGADGKLIIAPSVSPENTPSNLMPPAGSGPIPHPNPVVRNALMDVGILRDLLESLIELNETRPLDRERVALWKRMLEALPEYAVNADGTVKEWLSDDLSDNYRHRHLSHIYPLFPGGEVRKGHPLFDSFVSAVNLRELGAQSGWSLAHMAAIYARTGDAEAAFECVNTLVRSCLLQNFFTLHNDWRDMALTLNANSGAPVQLDALMGIVNAVQEMLMRWDKGRVNLLPACPRALSKGSFDGWRIPDAHVSCEWDADNGRMSARFTAVRDTSFTVSFPEFSGMMDMRVSIRESETFECSNQ